MTLDDFLQLMVLSGLFRLSELVQAQKSFV
jgi:hypothetical protein